MNSATWTCPRCGTVHSIYSMTCNCPAPSVATDSTDYVLDLRPMKSERMVLIAADRMARMEARLREWDEFISRCHSIIGEESPGAAHTLDQRIAALQEQIEAAHRAIDSIGLSRCADAHAGVYPDGRITCDDGRPPLSLVDRVEWLIRWLSDDPYPMGPRIKALEAQITAMRPVVDAAIAFVHQPGGRHYIPASLSPVCKLEEAVRTYEEVKHV